MKFLYPLLFLISLSLFSQKVELSDKAEVSVLTCAPGQNELYAAFGHSAIRVKDPAHNIDRVYNYGTFDFNTPNFYLKFCKGQLLYQLSSYEYKYFPYEYYKENRWIKSQVLNFTKEENQKIFDYLEWNALAENKDYLYDFFYDNCATKMYEVIEKSVGKIDFNYSEFPKDLTHRDLIHKYLAKNSWSKFGIDLALGAVIDKKATLKQYMFLPDYVYSGLKDSTINGKKLVKNDGFILPDHQLALPKTPFLLSPLFLSILIISITFYLRIFNKETRVWFNVVSITYGVLGLVLFALWFLTEHSTTKINMNLLWANPLLLCYPFIKASRLKQFCYFGLACLGGFLFIAITGFQQFDFSFYVLASCLIPLYLKPLLTFKI
ncbi:Lnb N-terminal periplasmic domain-containing protein [Wenyingzhuangia sp. IMCC45467]